MKALQGKLVGKGGKRELILSSIKQHISSKKEGVTIGRKKRGIKGGGRRKICREKTRVCKKIERVEGSVSLLRIDTRGEGRGLVKSNPRGNGRNWGQKDRRFQERRGNKAGCRWCEKRSHENC